MEELKTMRYKKSEFNYVHEKEDYALIYNTLYNSLIRLDADEYKQYLSGDEVNETLLENGIFVEKEVNEKAKYLACSQVYTLYMSRPLSITITTTLKCNARCTYCYEKGVEQQDIFDDAEEHIIKFIKRHMIRKEVQIIWFGGEPLMNIQFIDALSNRLTHEGIKFESYIITNGSLLTEDIINEKLSLWNVRNVQITLDGTKEEYEIRKNYINPLKCGFYNILNNIRGIAKKNVFVNIRLNIDRENKENILELLKEIDIIYANYENVVFYPAFITGSQYPMDEEEKVEYIKRMLLEVKNIKKLTAGNKLYSLPRMHACKNGDPRSFSIDVCGNVFTCDHYVGKEEKKIGNIAAAELEKDDRGYEILLREECNNCVFLPKCYGGCMSNYLEGDSPCMIEKYLIKAYLDIL